MAKTMQQQTNNVDKNERLQMDDKRRIAEFERRQDELARAARLADARELFVKHCMPRANALRFVDGMAIPCVVRTCRGDREGRRRR